MMGDFKTNQPYNHHHLHHYHHHQQQQKQYEKHTRAFLPNNALFFGAAINRGGKKKNYVFKSHMPHISVTTLCAELSVHVGPLLRAPTIHLQLYKQNKTKIQCFATSYLHKQYSFRQG